MQNVYFFNFNRQKNAYFKAKYFIPTKSTWVYFTQIFMPISVLCFTHYSDRFIVDITNVFKNWFNYSIFEPASWNDIFDSFIYIIISNLPFNIAQYYFTIRKHRYAYLKFCSIAWNLNQLNHSVTFGLTEPQLCQDLLALHPYLTKEFTYFLVTISHVVWVFSELVFFCLPKIDLNQIAFPNIVW